MALVKDKAFVQLVPPQPAVPAVTGYAFFMYAAPTPLGWAYRQLANGKPSNLSEFYGWNQVSQPKEYDGNYKKYKYYPIESLPNGINVTGAQPVYSGTGALLGYNVPVTSSATPLPPRYWGPITNMSFWKFDPALNGTLASNGYPTQARSAYTGYIDLPTVDGLQRITRTFKKDANGFLIPQAYTDPPNAVTYGTAAVMAHSFAGRAAVPAKAGIYTTDFLLGWNAGANSIGTVSGNAALEFLAWPQQALVCGFAKWPRAVDQGYNDISHGFYLDYSGGGQLRARVVEYGSVLSTSWAYDPSTTLFSVVRDGGVVSYFLGATKVFTSSTLSAGDIIAAVSMYRGGDAIGYDDSMDLYSFGGSEPPIDEIPGVGNGTLRLRGFGLGADYASYGGVGAGELSFYQQNVFIAPEEPIFVGYGQGEISLLAAYSYGPEVLAPGDGDGALFFDGFGSAYAEFGHANIPMFGFGISATIEDPGIPPEESPVDMQPYGATESLLLAEDASELVYIVHALRDAMTFGDGLRSFYNVIGQLTSSAIFADALRVVLLRQINSSLTLTDNPTAVLTQTHRILSQLLLADEAVPQLNAIAAVSVTLALADAVQAGRDVTIDDLLTVTDEVADQLTAIVRAVSQFIATDELTAQFALFAVVDSKLILDADPSALVSMLVELLDTIGLTARLRTDAGDVYAGYSVNVRNAAVTEYENFPFNSFAIVGGQQFAAGLGGIYRLGGGTDAGEDIAARLRTGLTNFGSNALKRVPNAYIGYTADGALLLKVITTDSGFKKERTYRLKARPDSAPTDNRFDIAKGLEAMYWGFELVNEDGADFEIDVVKIWPMVLNRRYSGR